MKATTTDRRSKLLVLVAWGLILATTAAVLGGLPTPSSAAEAPVRILPLGNSLTQGVRSASGAQIALDLQTGYRSRLESRFDAVGFDFDFVGTRSSGGAAMVDTDHEGVSGDRISEIRARAEAMIVAADPDVVLLMAGTNDVTDQGPGGSEPPVDTQPAADALAGLVESIADLVPGAEIIVSTIPRHLVYDDRVRSYNAKLPGIVAARAAAGDDVRLVDSYPVVTTDDMSDANHPDQFAYGKIADVWYRGLALSYPELIAAVPPAVATDDFNRADGALGVAPTGQLWTTTPGSFEWTIDQNEAAASGGTTEGVALLDVGESDVSVAADVNLSDLSGNPSLSFRALGNNNQLLAGLSRTASTERIALAKVEAGVPVVLSAACCVELDPTVDHRLRIEAVGSSVEVWVNDVLWIDHTLSSADQATFGSNTSHGLRARRDTGGEDGGSRWDNLVIRAIGAPPTTTTTTLPPTTTAPPTTAPPTTAPPTSPPDYQAIEQVRAVDTRRNGGNRVASNQTVRVPVASLGGPLATADSIAANLTVVNGTTNGYATLYPCDTPRPGTSTINYQPDRAIANGVITDVGPNGDVCIYVYRSAHVILDITGAFPPTTYQAIEQVRAVDTRRNGGNRVASNQTVRVPVASLGGPLATADSIAANLTVVNGTTNGYATLYPCDTPRPGTSTINYQPDRAIANGVITDVGPNGDVCIYVYRSAHVILDITGALP